MRIRYAAAAAVTLLAACKKEAPPVVYQAVPVETRDIVVSAQASGAIQPDTTVEVKSKASGEVLQILAETGQTVKRGDLLVRIDPRIPKNALAQAQAELEVARARLTNATSQKRRADELFKSQSITQQENETALLDYANARADVVRAQVAVDNAKIQLADAEVRSPITGTIIAKSVERGTLITSATGNVSGGTTLLKMADLQLVQVRTLVDETDIGKIQPGLPATVTVDAYPNRPFEGTVLKVEPLAETQQNVTMFPVLVRIQNREGLLKPGMNAEVEVHVGQREGVLAVPNAALRTPRDVASAAQVLGLNPEDVQKQIAAQQGQRASLGAVAAGGAAKPAGDSAGAAKPKNTMTMPDGREIPLPDGVTEKQVQAIFAKFRSGEQPSPAERAILQKLRGAGGGGGRAGAGGRQRGNQNTGSYIVFVSRSGVPTPVTIRTGLTDLDYTEVLDGLQKTDSVLVLPSASLVQSQQEFKDRFSRMTGGGALPGMQQQGGSRPQGAAGSGGAARPQGGR
jgi:HlyD family secretion protein